MERRALGCRFELAGTDSDDLAASQIVNNGAAQEPRHRLGPRIRKGTDNLSADAVHDLGKNGEDPA